MAWEKPINGTDTARADNADLQLRFYFSDAAATPPNALMAELLVTVDRADGSSVVYPVSAAVANIPAGMLSAAEKTQLMQLLAKARDAGLSALGFTQV